VTVVPQREGIPAQVGEPSSVDLTQTGLGLGPDVLHTPRVCAGSGAGSGRR
jgi:hypothetical protein